MPGTVVHIDTLKYYLDEPVVTPEMELALQRAEAIAASRLGCRELKYRSVHETIPANEHQGRVYGGLSEFRAVKPPTIFTADGPVRTVTELTLHVGTQSMNLLEGVRISDTGWAVHYRFPFAFGFKVDLPHNEALIDIEYTAGWQDEDDLPAGIRQFVLAQATQIYATPIGGVIKVRLGDNYVDLDQRAIAAQVGDYAKMMDQWVRVRL